LRGVHPDEERLAGGVLPLDEISRGSRGLVVDRFHALFRQRTRIFDPLLPDTPHRGSSVASSLSVAQEWITPRGPNCFLNSGKSFSDG
jgi:hypothetical protein